MKQPKPALGKPLTDRLSSAELLNDGDKYLDSIVLHKARVEALKAEAQAAMDALAEEYKAKLAPLEMALSGSEAALMLMMKSNKAVLFNGTDVVRLTHGSLIRSESDKVKIPRDALAKCEELGLTDVIKIEKSLDRDAVEKWPDSKLTLIGAVRKPKEEFSYDLKKEANS